MQIEPPPAKVFEDVSADLFEIAGSKYLVYVDRLSGWPTVDWWKARDPTSADVIKSLRKIFRDLGIPLRIRTDGGPQFKSTEFARFPEKWGVQQSLSTPHFPQSNGDAEAAVKAMKRLIVPRRSIDDGQLDSDEFAGDMLEYRNTPRTHGMSPAEILFGHKVRSVVPAHRSAFLSRWRGNEKLDEHICEEKRKAKELYDKGSKTLQTMKTGTSVWIDPKQRDGLRAALSFQAEPTVITKSQCRMAAPTGETESSSAQATKSKTSKRRRQRRA